MRRTYLSSESRSLEGPRSSSPEGHSRWPDHRPAPRDAYQGRAGAPQLEEHTGFCGGAPPPPAERYLHAPGSAVRQRSVFFRAPGWLGRLSCTRGPQAGRDSALRPAGRKAPSARGTAQTVLHLEHYGRSISDSGLDMNAEASSSAGAGAGVGEARRAWGEGGNYRYEPSERVGGLARPVRP